MKENRKNLTNKERKEFADVATMRLNSQVRKYGGFTSGGKSFRMGAKITDRGGW